MGWSKKISKLKRKRSYTPYHPNLAKTKKKQERSMKQTGKTKQNERCAPYHPNLTKNQRTEKEKWAKT